MATKPSLFDIAKQKGATASKGEKLEVSIHDPEFHQNLSRLADLTVELDSLKAEAEMCSARVKERSIKEFVDLYAKNAKYPGSFSIRATGIPELPAAALMFIPTDKYLKIDETRYNELLDLYGPNLVSEKTVYTMNAELVEKYGQIISDLVMNAKGISEEDKLKLISASVSYEVKKGTIQEVSKFEGSLSNIIDDIRPVYQMKNVRNEEA